jgi:myo-inositol 2-dehydrogenase/D-chiro-inositol 1-dehydrogenase
VCAAGRIGIVHLEALGQCPTAKPIIISNPTVSKAEAAAKMYPGMEWTSSDMEVINHPDVEAVWICSPSQFHADQIKACAEAGKHIFCEKPIAVSLSETFEAVNLCREKNVKLMTALQRRFDPSFQRVREGITNGDVGDPIIVKLCSRDPEPPPLSYVEGGGGLFKDMAVHDLDMARFLMGSEPTAVLASGSCCVSDVGSLKGPEAFDTAMIMVRFANGREAVIDVCRQAPYGYDQRAEVLGTKGMLMTDNMHPSTAKLFCKDFVGQADLPYDFFMSRYKEAYKQETLAFVDCLVKDEPVPCSGRDGLVALIMAIAAGISAEENRWVQFQEVLEREGILGTAGGSSNEGGAKSWVKNALRGIERDPTSEADLRECFFLFDLDGDYEINVEELTSIIQLLSGGNGATLLCNGAECSPSLIRDMFTQAQRDKDAGGTITFDEFLDLWKRAGNIVKEPKKGKVGAFRFFDW